MALRYIEVKGEIRRLIEGMRAHSKVPSRQWLCNKYGVSRSTVDKAIAELVDENYLYTIQGSGTYIQERSDLNTIINIAVILPSIMEGGYPALLNGIERYASSKNINVIICGSENNSQKQHDYIKRLLESKVDGCIIIPSINTEKNYESFLMLQNSGTPFVFCNRFVDGFDVPFLGNNNYYGAYSATKHLIDIGCEKIAYMAARKYTTSIERYYGFMTAMLDNNLEINQEYILHDNESVEVLKNQITQVFSKEEYPDGVVCFNDTMAGYVYTVLQEKQIMIGDAVKVIGYDDGPICETLPITLSSVSAKSEQVGFEAAKHLIEIINHEVTISSNNVHLFTPELKLRQSTLGTK